MSSTDSVSPRDRRRLTAPPDYQWTDEEVIYEKNHSFLTGACVAAIVTAMVVMMIVVVTGC